MEVLKPNFARRGGVVSVVVQDYFSKQILMVAWTDQAGYLETLATGQAVYFSTSRQKRWKKGEESGHTQAVRTILVDCDGDALIYVVEQTGVACHTDAESCFFRTVMANGQLFPAPKYGIKEELPLIKAEVSLAFSGMCGFKESRRKSLQKRQKRQNRIKQPKSR